MKKIMIIRHAEKHQHGAHQRGVTGDGRPAPHELTVRGWQRAAALVHLFAPPDGRRPTPPLARPRSIFASDATPDSPSLRAMHTAGPLAHAIGIPVNHDYAEDQEPALALAAAAAASPVLIVWHHNHISRLTRDIAGVHVECPSHWPDDRFDLVWILDWRRGEWAFSQAAQRLMPEDSVQVI